MNRPSTRRPIRSRALQNRRGRRRRLAAATLRASSWLLVFGLLLLSGCGKTQPVATVTTEADANEIISLLSAHHLEARKEPGGEEGHRHWRVLLDERLFAGHELAAALQVLEAHGLPRPTDQGLEKAYEEGGMFPSESAQKAQRLKELKTELERQLRHLPGVIRVSANVVMPEDGTINLNPYPATAAILIVSRDERPSFADDDIKEMVARGVPKLKPTDVSVVRVHEPPRMNATAAPLTSPRDGLIYATGGGSLAVFIALLLVLRLQSRRRRGAGPAPPAFESAHTPPADADLTEEVAPPAGAP